jgi:hypothetical protein
MANKGFLLVTMQPPPALEEEFNAWYDTEHVPERAAVPGFITALRFVCLTGFPRYLAMYDLESHAVLETPEYLRVAYDRSSPWTRRVTSRVKVWRSSGDQVWPGNLVTRRCARVVLLRFRGLPAAAQPAIIEGVRSNFEHRPETIQCRVLAHNAGAGVFDYMAFVEARAPTSDALDLATFGPHAADALDTVNAYAPY